MKKKILASILAVAMMFTLTACGSSQAGVQMKEDGSIMTYTEEDLPEGLYVKSGDTYYPLLNATEADAAEANYQWFTEFDQLIPEMGEDDTLILYSTSEVPQSFTFWKMTDFGYTVGIRFQQAETSKDLTFPSDQNGYCSYSPVGTYILETTFGGAGEGFSDEAFGIYEDGASGAHPRDRNEPDAGSGAERPDPGRRKGV